MPPLNWKTSLSTNLNYSIFHLEAHEILISQQVLSDLADRVRAERAERILLIFLGAAISSLMPIVMWILAIFTNLTVIQRIYYTWSQTKDREERQ
jgi:phosphatidylglycerophosphate synthase